MNSALDRIRVSLLFHEQPVHVGDLVQDGRLIHFRFTPDFLELKLPLSPIKLQQITDVQTGPGVPFDGLHGVFADSIPDGWGRLLLDRSLQSQGYLLSGITPLQRLSFVGRSGMGALIYEPDFAASAHADQDPDLDVLAREINHVLEGTASDYLEELMQFQGSSGGARPKIVAGYHPANHQLFLGDQLPAGFEHWIIKFKASIDLPDAAELEYAYYQMALNSGIEMMPSRLLFSRTGKAFFATKRFDREANRRLHMHTAAGLMHDDFRLSQLDYGHLLSAAFELEKDIKAYEKVFRLAAFNVFACNRDDHSKNFSFLMDENGQWRFAPAYDLTFSLTTHGFQSTSVAGESQQPGTKNLLQLADVFDIGNGKDIIEEVKEAVSGWKNIAANVGVSEESKRLVWREINAKLSAK